MTASCATVVLSGALRLPSRMIAITVLFRRRQGSAPGLTYFCRLNTPIVHMDGRGRDYLLALPSH